MECSKRRRTSSVLEASHQHIGNNSRRHQQPEDVIGDYRKLFNAYNRSAIIFDDFNAYSTLFGADSANDRGRLLEELIEEHNIVFLNTGAGTFDRPSGEMSHLDVAIASANISRIAN